MSSIWSHIDDDSREEVITSITTMMTEVKPEYQSGSYEKIARKWITDMPLHVYSLYDFDRTDGVQISLTKLRHKHFSYSYKQNGKNLYWFDWFTKNYPIWTELTSGTQWKGNTRAVIHPDREALINSATPEQILNIYAEETTDHNQVDYIDVDVDNLTRYISQSENNLIAQSHRGKTYTNSLKRYIIDAKKIMKFAVAINEEVVNPLTGDIRYVIPQPYKISPFGRKYYTGNFALQNKSGAVRTASMGRCYSVDINTSVFAYYRMLADMMGIEASVLDRMLADKHKFRAELATTIQNVSTDTRYIVQEIIKPALTSMGFGARDTSWWDPERGTQGALSKIAMNMEDRNRLIAHPEWIALKTVYNQIKLHIKTDMSDIVDEYKNDPQYWVNKKFTMDRLMSLLYQQYESNVMNDCIQQLQMAGREPKLWVHDGVYTLLDPHHNGHWHVILDNLRKTHNPYLDFEIELTDAYTVVNVDREEQRVAAHQDLVRQQEMVAKQWAKDNLNPDRSTPSETMARLKLLFPENYQSIQEHERPPEPYPGYYDELESEGYLTK